VGVGSPAARSAHGLAGLVDDLTSGEPDTQRGSGGTMRVGGLAGDQRVAVRRSRIGKAALDLDQLGDVLPGSAGQEVGAALRFQPEPGAPLPLGRDAQVGDESPAIHARAAPVTFG